MEMNNEWVQDPKVFNINREKAHASIHCYASLEEMHTNKSSYIGTLTVVDPHISKNVDYNVIFFVKFSVL